MKKCMSVYETVAISEKDNLAVSFLYNTPPGRALLRLLIRPRVSKLAGRTLDTPATKVFIRGFIKRNNINIKEYKDVKYKSFNDFFIREIREEHRPLPDDARYVASPCDGKLTAYEITPDSVFRIKNSIYTVDDLLQDSELAGQFINGLCLIFRLSPDDYHRYFYIDDGQVVSRKRINGVLHTVKPISQQYKVFSRNAREYEVMQTDNFGKVIQMEVGALFVGRITNHETAMTFSRGDEKGMFEFGGSTVIMLFQKNSIELDGAIFENTRNNKETIVRMGCKIGEKA
jgi:phosphatidylserine decarboxylase